MGLTPTTINATKDADLIGGVTITNWNVVAHVLPFTWTITGLPPGVTFDVSNAGTQLSWGGRPSAAGTFPAHVVIRDSSSGTPIKVDTTLTLVVDTTFKFSTNFVPQAVVGLSYSHHIDVANGVAPLTYQLIPLGSSSIAPGISFNNSTGILSGTATGINPSTSLTVRVTDSSAPPRTIEALFGGFEAVPQLAFSNQTITLLRGVDLFPRITFSGGVPMVNARIISGSLPPGMTMETVGNGPFFFLHGLPTQVGDWTATIELTDSYTPPEVLTANVHFRVNNIGPSVQTFLPHAIIGAPYTFNLSADNGTRPLTWSVSGLPPGLTAGSDGLITGTPTATGSYFPTISVTDSSIPTASNTKNPNLIVKAFTGRNDSIATATAITNGDYQASLSPYANASNVPQPDQDFYKVVVAPGSTLSVLVFPLNLSLAAATTDPVLEFVDGTGLRLSNCKVPGATTFSSPCLNDDVDPGVNHSSQLYFKNDGTSDVTIYLHVLDWAGRARPDLLYGISISGAK